MPEKPNILFVLTDQMRADCLGAAGHPVLETPNLDDLAGSGVRFTSAFSPCPSCIAARASLFTGLSPSGHGRLGYRDRVPWRYTETLAELLSAAGYQTHCVGKTHFFPQRLPLGFEATESYECQQNFGAGYVNDYHAWLAAQTGGRIREFDHGLQSNSWVSRPSHLPEELHNNTWVASRCMEFLRRRDRARPFFLFMSFHRPHAPLDPPGSFWAMYRDRPVAPPPVGDWAAENDLPVSGVNAWRGRLPAETLARARRAYWAQIAHIDCQIGRVFEFLLREAQAGPTWVIFTSDHGEMLGDHHLFRKTYAYQGSAGIPLIVCPPEGPQSRESLAAARRESAVPVTLTDLYPTVLEIAGLHVPARTQGKSLLPLVRGGTGLRGREYVHGEHAAGYDSDGGMQYLTDGRRKYVWFTLSGREQLFDLGEDPQELHNLAGETRWRGALELWRSRLVKELASREEDGLSDGKHLVPGKKLPDVRPALLAAH